MRRRMVKEKIQSKFKAGVATQKPQMIEMSEADKSN